MRKMKKRGIAIVALCLVLALTTGCFNRSQAEKTFADNGLTITLTEAFTKMGDQSFTVSYQSDKILVAANKEDFSFFEGYAESLDDYAQLVLLVNDLDCEIIEKDGLTYFVYESTVDGEEFSYLASLYQGSEAFWMVNFICEKADFSKLESTILAYAASVQVE